MYHWITIIGSRPIAALNTLWYFKENFPRKQIIKFSLFVSKEESDMNKNIKWFTQRADILCKNYNNPAPSIEKIPYIQRAVDDFRKDLKKIIQQSQGKIVIDMTSGRKANSSLLLLMGELFTGKVSHIFYNFLMEDDYMSFPYPAIPPGKQQVIDLLKR